MNKFIILPLILVGCTAPVTHPPAEACSPRLDGEPTYCPEPDASCLSFDCPSKDKVTLPKKEVKGELDVYDINHWHTLHSVYIDNLRRSRIEQTATKPSDSIDSALADFWSQETLTELEE